MPLDSVLQEIMGHIQGHKVLNAMQVCRLLNKKSFGYCTRTAMGKDQTEKMNQYKLKEHCQRACNPIYWQVLTSLGKLVRMGLLMQLKTRFWDGNISGKRTDVFTFYFEKLQYVVDFMEQPINEVYGDDRV